MNKPRGVIRVLTAATVCGASLATVYSGISLAEPLPEKFVFTRHIGWNVDKTKVEQTGTTQQERNICTIGSGDACQTAPEASLVGSLAGAFELPIGLAVANNGDVYVGDQANHRVQVLDPTGRFMFMFGWNVNKKKVAEGAPQQERNMCREESTGECQAGEPGERAGHIKPVSVAVDQASGNVYVLEGARVNEFTGSGEFVLMIGKKVNKNGTNLCLAAESSECQSGEPDISGEHSAFNFREADGSLLAVGGPKDLLYVGDQARVQEFQPNGQWVNQIPLTELSQSAKAAAITVDSSGDVFVVDAEIPGVHEYSPTNQLQPLVIDGSSQEITALAIDAFGRIGVIDKGRGALYSTTGFEISQFVPPSGTMIMPGGAPTALAFAFGRDDLYVPKVTENEIDAYKAAVVAHLESCSTEQLGGTSVVLKAAVNPNGIGGTEVWLQYETIEELEKSGWENATNTPKQPIPTDSSVHQFSAPVSELVPNQEYVCRAAGQDDAFRPNGREEPLSGEPLLFKTEPMGPSIERPPEVPFVHSETATLRSELNPEHALTKYHFEYVTDAQFHASGFTNALSTLDNESSLYAVVGVTQEITGLTPATTYHVRLTAIDSEHNLRTEGPETTFTTSPPVAPLAVTGGHSAVTATTAIIAGEVRPDGQAAVYKFELGIYKGAETQYGVIFSGPAGESTSFTPEDLQLSGLQPGTTYAYRIKIESSYGISTGATATFTTEGLPTVLEPPVIARPLPMPEGMSFPKQPPAPCRRGYKRNKHGRCVRTPKHRKIGHTRRKKGRHARQVRRRKR